MHLRRDHRPPTSKLTNFLIVALVRAGFEPTRAGGERSRGMRPNTKKTSILSVLQAIQSPLPATLFSQNRPIKSFSLNIKEHTNFQLMCILHSYHLQLDECTGN
jgi:hypothetical protein